MTTTTTKTTKRSNNNCDLTSIDRYHMTRRRTTIKTSRDTKKRKPYRISLTNNNTPSFSSYHINNNNTSPTPLSPMSPLLSDISSDDLFSLSPDSDSCQHVDYHHPQQHQQQQIDHDNKKHSRRIHDHTVSNNSTDQNNDNDRMMKMDDDTDDDRDALITNHNNNANSMKTMMLTTTKTMTTMTTMVITTSESDEEPNNDNNNKNNQSNELMNDEKMITMKDDQFDAKPPPSSPLPPTTPTPTTVMKTDAEQSDLSASSSATKTRTRKRIYLNTKKSKDKSKTSNVVSVITYAPSPKKTAAIVLAPTKKEEVDPVQLAKLQLERRRKKLERIIKKRKNSEARNEKRRSEGDENEDLCIVCDKGGFLICCDGCSNACHCECDDPPMNAIPEGAWFCIECRLRKELGEELIGRVSADKCMNNNDNSKNKGDVNNNEKDGEEDDGSFEIQLSQDQSEFDQSISSLPPIPTQSSLSSSSYTPHRRRKRGSSSGGGIVQWNPEDDDTEEVKQAKERSSKWRRSSGRTKNEIDACFESGSVPEGFMFIQSNLIHSSATKFMDLGNDIPNECNCASQCGINCINRQSRIECHKSCVRGSNCFNQNFSQMIYPAMYIFQTENRGQGVKADEHIKKGTFITEYCGEVISVREFETRHRNKKSKTSFYSMSLTSSVIIDASQKGNFGRFFNHSCSPNCFCELWEVNGEGRVGIFAKRDIEIGEELTYNYNFECYDAGVVQRCNCGSSKCCGFIGTLEESEKENDDDCMKCGKGGLLMCCETCSNACHCKCDDPPRKSIPKGKWYCTECRSKTSSSKSNHNKSKKRRISYAK